MTRTLPLVLAFLLSWIVVPGVTAAPAGPGGETAADAGSVPLVGFKTLQVLEGPPSRPMIMPTDVAIGPDQRAYVVDSGNNRVLIYSKQGRFLSAFGRPGEGRGELLAPVGIAVAGDGSVLVADRGNRRIQVFDADGGFLRSIPTLIDGRPVAPVDVAVDDVSGRLYVTISKPVHQVLVYGPGGKVTARWGKPGSNFGEFRYPATLALDANRHLYVVDVFNSRVQVLDGSGRTVVTVGAWGVTPGRLFRPKGVTLRDDGRILVSDSYLGVIQLFRSDTRFSAVLGRQGQIAHFDTPVGIAAGAGRRLYVPEMLANRVSVLELEY